ncbi:alpha/beta hydrolase [Roseitalea porphyridii]|uniref:Alpha/beta hydrolase n=2 Tax=Roseitalea porphyridii TaxID=1852022 RepID=A0A4V1A487_9HYPH|nr:alpha/beta hydrolase [Roseitalea porphyridii]
MRMPIMSVLLSFPGNPCPEPFRQGRSRTGDGFALRYCVFRTAVTPCQGAVVLLHGRNECIEKYAETCADLLARGFDVCTFDWRGQGGSTRFFRDARRGYVDDFAQYEADLDHMLGEVFLAEARPPFFIVAHSMGALVALLAAPQLTNRINRMVLSAPFLGLSPESPPPSVLGPVTGLMRHVGMGRAYMGAGPRGITAVDFAVNKLTHDRRRFARNQAILDPARGLGLGGPTAGWLRASISAMDRVADPAHMAAIRVPAVIVAAGADRVVSNAVTEAFGRRMRIGSMIMVPGARHELMQEADGYRDQFWAAFEAFVPGRAG